MKNKKVKEQNKSFVTFSLYDDISKNKDIIDYQKLLATVLLETKLGFESQEYKKFVQEYNQALEKKFDIVFKSFVITFNVNLRFSENVLVPMISKVESSNTDAINFSQTSDEKFNIFLNAYNLFIDDLLDKNNYVEILPNIIIFKSQNTNALKIVFDDKYVVFKGE